MTEPSKIVIRRTEPGDIPSILDIFNRLRPERPPMTPEEYQLHLREIEGKRYEAWVADLDGEIVGDFDLFEARWIASPDTFLLYGEVKDGFQGKGIGSRLYTTMESRARAIGARRIYTEVQETLPESIAFFEHRGWVRTGREDRPSRLEVARANLDGFTGVEERLNRAGIRIATLAEIGSENEDFLRAVHDMESLAEKDIPSSEPPAREPFQTWLYRQLHGPGRSLETFWVALDTNRPVGVARLRRTAGNTVGNGLTAVHPDYRGRGIARALKMRTIRWAREHGMPYMFTANDAKNTRMLAINNSLGYTPLPADIEMMKEFAE